MKIAKNIQKSAGKRLKKQKAEVSDILNRSQNLLEETRYVSNLFSINLAKVTDKEWLNLKQEVIGWQAAYDRLIKRLIDEGETLKARLADLHTKSRGVDETKADFLSVVSHQLRTPLTVSILNIEMLLAGYRGKITADQGASLQEILVSLKKMTEMLNIYSIVSKIELETFVPKPRALDLPALAKSIIFEHKKRYPSKTKITADFDSKIPSVEGDPDLWKIALTNVISYSIKASSVEGKETVIIGRLTDVGVFLSVKSFGPSLSVVETENIFNKGFRLDGSNKEDLADTGFGFYITRKIINLSGGDVWLESDDKKGTVFHIFLPNSRN